VSLGEIQAGIEITREQDAAIALVHGLTVVTRNVKDFDGFGVALFNPFDFKGPREQRIGVDLGKNSSWPRRSSGPMELGPATGKRGYYCNHFDL
jgi:hypothetical protein